LGNSGTQARLFNALSGEEFFSRHNAVQRLFHAGLDVARLLQSSCFLNGKRKSGKSEVLKQAYNRLFWEQDFVIPFFHAIPKSLTSAETFCREYFLQNVLQCIGFLRKDAQLVMSDEHDLNRIVQLAYQSRLSWLIAGVDHYQLFLRNRDLQALSRLSVLFPATVAARTGLPAFVFIDDLHRLASLTPDTELSLLTADFLLALQSRQAPHCLTGSTRRVIESLFLTAELPVSLEVMSLSSWEPSEAQQLLEGLCRRCEVECDPVLSNYVVRELDCNPFYIRYLVQAARRDSVALLTARQFADLYSFELIEGNLHLYFNSLMHSAPLNATEHIKAIELMHFCAHAPLEFSALHYLKTREAAQGLDVEKILNALAALELIDFGLGIVSSIEDTVLRDWCAWNFRHKIEGAEISRVRYELSSGMLKRCEQSRSLRPRASGLEKLKNALGMMKCQPVPQVLFNFFAFATPQESRARDNELILPEMIAVTLKTDVSSATSGFASTLITGRGFERGSYTNETEIAWLAAFCPGPGAAGLDEIRQFHQRCERARREENFQRVRLWLVTESKFNRAAQSFADMHQIFTSNLEQLRLLVERMTPRAAETAESVEAEEVQAYELTIPLYADAELVAIRALEQIADFCNFDEKSRGQIRMALMEACVSVKGTLPAQGRIRLTFRATPDRLTIYLRTQPPDALTGAPQFLGMDLLNSLMDEVRLQYGHSGFELVMVKSPRSALNAKGGAG
jgi:hypothetical protein